jgi:hypothetical protein
MTRPTALALVILLGAAGCGSGEEQPCDACDTPDAGGGGGDWTSLITGNWTLAPGGEKTSDLHTRTLDRDVYVKAIRPIEPVGTHHTVLARGSGLVGNVIYASGVGTNAFHFPDGVGLKLPRGSLLTLQLHIYNPSDNALTGTSGIEVIEVGADEIVHEAGLFLPGPMSLSLPANQETTVSGTCTVQSAQTVFGLFPHMHKLGTHFKTTLTVGGTEQVIHDRAYDFDEQEFLAFDPIALAPGDAIHTRCTWYNDTNRTVGWGESSDSEMCFSILYRYPALGSGLGFCNN